ncbi:MAG: helix-turn-helix domain-containing protein [Pontiella sp.]
MSGYAIGGLTKQKIIAAAGELAAEVGFDNITTRMVADRSGENIGSIHYHFGGKEGLFEEVVLAAFSGCQSKEDQKAMVLPPDTSCEELSRMIREIVKGEITDMFRSDRPGWHVPVIYQLLQREDKLYTLFEEEILKPSMEHLVAFFRLIDPKMSDEDIHLHAMLMKMPVFGHADYMKTMLRTLKMDRYSDAYLQRMEDLIVKQTQLVLGLPLDIQDT